MSDALSSFLGEPTVDEGLANELQVLRELAEIGAVEVTKSDPAAMLTEPNGPQRSARGFSNGSSMPENQTPPASFGYENEKSDPPPRRKRRGEPLDGQTSLV